MKRERVNSMPAKPALHEFGKDMLGRWVFVGFVDSEPRTGIVTQCDGRCADVLWIPVQKKHQTMSIDAEQVIAFGESVALPKCEWEQPSLDEIERARELFEGFAIGAWSDMEVFDDFQKHCRNSTDPRQQTFAAYVRSWYLVERITADNSKYKYSRDKVRALRSRLVAASYITEESEDESRKAGATSGSAAEPRATGREDS